MIKISRERAVGLCFGTHENKPAATVNVVINDTGFATIGLMLCDECAEELNTKLDDLLDGETLGDYITRQALAEAEADSND